MRHLVLGLLVLSAGGAANGQPAPAQRYVPQSLPRPDQDPDFYENWFGGQLRAMGEPALTRPQDLGNYRRRFRMTVLPSFHPAYAIRVDEKRNGSAVVTITRLSGAGGYEPGRVSQREHYSLDRAAVRELDSAIAESAFVGLPFKAEMEPERDGSITVCADGVEFVFELIDSRGVSFVPRHECDLRYRRSLRALVAQVDSLRRQVGSDLPQYLR